MRFALATAILVSLVVTPALAEPVDDATRAAARELGADGVTLADAGRHVEAVEKFERALELFPVPTLALLSGKSLEASGRWVEAVERYRRARAMRIDPELPQAFRETQHAAQEEATALERALAPRLPTLAVRLIGSADASVTVWLDGRPLAAALLGVPMPVDPGTHQVVVRNAARIQERTVQLAEAQRAEVAFSMAVAPARGRPEAPARAAPNPSDLEDSRPSWRTAGWISVAAGGAALGVGVVAHVSARHKADELELSCVGGRCPQSERGALDSYERTKTLATVAYIVAGVGLATGTTLLVLSSERAGPGRVGVSLGAGGAHVVGQW